MNTKQYSSIKKPKPSSSPATKGTHTPSAGEQQRYSGRPSNEHASSRPSSQGKSPGKIFNFDKPTSSSKVA
jgi:hypothetical protein